MTRLNVLLLVALLFSAVYLVRVSHESRQLFAALDKARNEERLLDNEFERLLSDKQTQATPLRVEKTAREKLGMRNATPAITQYVSRAGAAVSLDAASAAGGAR
jgi:cell division protein FtsL